MAFGPDKHRSSVPFNHSPSALVFLVSLPISLFFASLSFLKIYELCEKVKWDKEYKALSEVV